MTVYKVKCAISVTINAENEEDAVRAASTLPSLAMQNWLHRPPLIAGAMITNCDFDDVEWIKEVNTE